jgi:hypothetical protein
MHAFLLHDKMYCIKIRRLLWGGSIPHEKTICRRLLLKCDGTRAETRFRLSAKRTSLFKSAGESVQSTTGRWGVLISGSNAGYNMFRCSVKSTGYSLHSPVSPSFPPPPPVRHRVPSHFNWTLTLQHRFLAYRKKLDNSLIEQYLRAVICHQNITRNNFLFFLETTFWQMLCL